MAIRNNRIFGLAVPLSLADVVSRSESLRNLDINREDLEIIRGISSSGFDKLDLQTISNLTVPVWRSFDRYINDVLTYQTTLTLSGGADFQLRGNLEVAGGLGSTAFRYKILDTEPDPQNPNATPILKWGDISTSRVSSWSTIGTNISYGGDVQIGGTLSVGKIKTRTVATTKDFDSEVPTHRIRIDLNGTQRYIYAMKGIPLRFSGFFRNFLARIDFTPVLGKKVSWRIIRDDGLTSPEDFPSYGNNTQSILDYRSPFSAQRTIEVYYSPDAISRIDLANTNITSIPRVRLNNLDVFNFNNNGIVDFPDVNFFAPTLTFLNINNNPFYNSSTVDERKLNQLIVDKIPASLTYLDLRGCFFGGIEQGVFSKFTALRTLFIDRSSGVYFYPDSTNPNGELPFFSDVNGGELRSLYARNNDFRSFGTPAGGSGLYSVKQLDNLVNLFINDNLNLVDNNFSIASPDIVNVEITRTQIRCPNLQAKPLLETFRARQNPNIGSLFIGWDGTTLPLPAGVSDASYKFANCPALRTLSFYFSGLTGYIPQFLGNPGLNSIDMRGCNGLIAGRPGKANVRCLYDDTFIQAPNVQTFYLSVNNPSFAGEIDRNTFVPLNESLVNIQLTASGRFQDPFPDFEGCQALQDFYSPNQGWGSTIETTLPNFAAAFSMVRIRLQGNNFTGSIQYNNKNSLDYLDVSNNNLTSISPTFNAPVLTRLYASSNNFAGSLPALDVSCPNVQYVTLNNNSFTTYLRNTGLVDLPQLREIDLSANLLSQTAVDNVLFDFVDQYELYPRSGVVVDLTGSNAAPSPYPIIYGIVTAYDPLIQPTIVNGVFTDLGSAGGIADTTNVAPKTGIYSNVSTAYVNSPAGDGLNAKVSLEVNVTFDDDVVTSIDAANFTAPNNDPALYESGKVETLNPFTVSNNLNDPATYESGNVDTLGAFTANGNTPAQGIITSISGVINAPGNNQPLGVITSLGAFNAPGNAGLLDGVVDALNNATLTTAGTYTAGTKTTTSATGSGLTVDVTVDGGGVIQTVVINNGGSGYASGDTISIDGGTGGTTTIDVQSTFDEPGPYSPSGINTLTDISGNGTTDATFNLTIVNGRILSLFSTPVSGGAGYTTAETVQTLAGSSNPADIVTIDITGVTDPPGPYSAGTYSDISGNGTLAATFDVATSNGKITGVTLLTGGEGYSATNIQTLAGSSGGAGDTVTVAITGTQNVTPNYLPGTYADTSGNGTTNANIEVVTNAGQVISVAVATPDKRTSVIGQTDNNGSGYSGGDTIILPGYSQTITNTTYTYDIQIPVSTVYNENPAYFGYFPAAGDYTDETTGIPAGRTRARVRITKDANGFITSITPTLAIPGLIGSQAENERGTGYTAGDTILLERTQDDEIQIGVATVYDQNPAYFGYYPANASGTVYSDTSVPAGGSAASVALTTDASGFIQSIALSPVGGPSGDGYSIGDTIDFLGDVSVEVDGITPRYYTSGSYSLTRINNGGFNYAVTDLIRTSNSINFERNANTASNQNIQANIELVVNSITQRVDTSQFKGVAAVAFLRDAGWTIQVNN